MASEFALMKAAQAWQTKATSHIWMEPDLAEAFADILDACMVNPSEATQAQLGAPVEDRKVSASDPVSASDQMETYRWDRASTLAIIEAFIYTLPEGFPDSKERRNLEELVFADELSTMREEGLL